MDEAFEYDFKCPLCGKILHPVDYSEKIKELEEERAALDEKISKITKHYKNFVKKRSKK